MWDQYIRLFRDTTTKIQCINHSYYLILKTLHQATRQWRRKLKRIGQMTSIKGKTQVVLDCWISIIIKVVAKKKHCLDIFDPKHCASQSLNLQFLRFLNYRDTQIPMIFNLQNVSSLELLYFFNLVNITMFAVTVFLFFSKFCIFQWKPKVLCTNNN